MSKATQPDLGWEVLAQATGEVLTAEARSPGLHLGLLGVPSGFDAGDAEGWLYDVAGVSHEASATRPSSRPIPPILDHAVTGLLFSHAELWDQPGTASPCSFAFVEGRGEVGFGWVGDAKVSVWVDGRLRESGFVTLHDGRGRFGRAWSVPAHHNVQVRISWNSGDPLAGGAEVEASWTSDDGSAPGYQGVPGHVVMEEEPVRAPASGLEPAHAARVVEPGPVLPPVDIDAEIAASLREGGLAQASAETADIEVAAGAAAEVAAEPAVEVAPEPRRERGLGAWLRRTFGWLGGRRAATVEAAEEEAVWREAAGLAPGEANASEVVAAAEVPALEAPEPHVVTPDVAGPVEEASVEEAPVAEAGYEELAEVQAASQAEPVLEEPPAYEDLVASGTGETVESDVWGESDEQILPAPELEVVSAAEEVENIPPTPEPLELTEKAVGWDPDLDPRGIDLSRSTRRLTYSSLDDLAHGRDDLDLDFGDVAIGEPAAAEAASPVDTSPVNQTPVEKGSTEIEPPEPAIEPASVAKLAVEERLAQVEAALPPAPAPIDEPGPDATHAPGESLTPAWSAVSPQHPAWPTAEELARDRRVPAVVRRAWPWVAIVVVLFAVGWLVGTIQDDGRPRDAAGGNALSRVLRVVGLGGPRYLVQVSSRPPGAWITVDGEPMSLRTPAAIEVTPGDHSVGLSFSEFGSATYPVRGRKGERIALDPTLWGSLEITAPEDFGVIAVTIDGVPRGVAPMTVDSLAPGVHDVRFSAAGMEPWGQTVEVRVGESHELLARAVQSPSSGVLQVQASFTDETGTQPLRGAQVWIDGELRGTTPLILDLPRGPHSIRLAHKGHEAPIQVIDLPGGNQRFAVFELGLDAEVARLGVDLPARIPRDRPTVVSATVLGIAAGEVREMWLHVRMPEGAWRRYAMTLLKAPAGAAGVATFPTAAFDGQGRARYYVSAQSRQGDEIFTEIRGIGLESAASR